MNSNLAHNLINGAGLVLAGGTAALLASGCTADTTGAIECTQSFINPTYTALAVPALFLLKLAINVVRDGVSGLIKPQPPVQK